MIQLEQQQHREFWVGWVGQIPTTYIQLAGAGSIISLFSEIILWTVYPLPYIHCTWIICISIWLSFINKSKSLLDQLTLILYQDLKAFQTIY